MKKTLEFNLKSKITQRESRRDRMKRRKKSDSDNRYINQIKSIT